MNYEILTKAGVSKALFAEMVGVSHVAVYGWLHGRCKPHALREKKVKKVLTVIERAVECGDLPVTVGSGENPTDLIVAAISKHLDAARSPK